MTLMELKNFITEKIVPTDFMIFVSKDNPYLATQYVKALGELSVGGINKITSIYEPQQSSLMLLTSSAGSLKLGIFLYVAPPVTFSSSSADNSLT